MTSWKMTVIHCPPVIQCFPLQLHLHCHHHLHHSTHLMKIFLQHQQIILQCDMTKMKTRRINKGNQSLKNQNLSFATNHRQNHYSQEVSDHKNLKRRFLYEPQKTFNHTFHVFSSLCSDPTIKIIKEKKENEQLHLFFSIIKLV